MTCINCASPATFVFSAPGTKDQPYCKAHLPAAYRGSDLVQPAPDEDLVPVSQIADVEPLAEVKAVDEAPADELDDPNPLLKLDKPVARRSRKSPGER